MRPEFDAAGLTDAIGQEHFYPSVNLAVAALASIDNVGAVVRIVLGPLDWVKSRRSGPVSGASGSARRERCRRPALENVLIRR